MAQRRLLHLAAVVIALGVFTVGCTPPEPSQPTASPTSASQQSSVTPSASATISTSEANAIARARAYIATIDNLSSDPKTNLDQLSAVARGDAADKWRQILLDDRSAGHRQTGTTKISLIRAKAGSSDQQWSVTMCLDLSNVDVVDKSGKSVVSKSRPDRVRDVLTVAQDTASSQWYVTEDKATTTC